MCGSGRAIGSLRSTRPTSPRPAAFRVILAAVDTGQLRHLSVRPENSTQGAQGRLVLMCAELLSPLSSRCTPCAADRHIYLPRQLQMCHARIQSRMSAALRPGAGRRAPGAGRDTVGIYSHWFTKYYRARIAARARRLHRTVRTRTAVFRRNLLTE